MNRYNCEVNGYFLCDRGRFGYEFVNSPQRVKEALLKTADGVQEVSKEEALRLASHMIGMAPKILKNSFQNVCASAFSERSPSHSREKAKARSLISFKDNGI